ncbi:uncharacterized protein LOC111329738 [Stylophora pistillata]|uniref:DDE Tnp4 domain-containing protein n=1 Tax=Stylophora pistillata TaxID=50429 RepID=A0A2B4SBF2_STYPI|nr:uncharacterized protein LOC111329738 [Stylophora pistillata]PFX25908.1 hypothetical protein AWC38_SpisGene9464 [Stylophora pistillata]
MAAPARKRGFSVVIVAKANSSLFMCSIDSSKPARTKFASEAVVKKSLEKTYSCFRGRLYIKDDAIPSIFAWSVASPNRKSPRKRNYVVEIPSSCPTMDNLATNENNKEDTLDKEIADLRAQVATLLEESLILQETNKDLIKSFDEQLRNQFGILKFKESDSDVNFFTGFPNYQTLLTCYNFLNPGTNRENIAYVSSVTDEVDFMCASSIESKGNKPGKRRKLSTLDEFFMVLVIMRLGLFKRDLAHRFHIHLSTVNRICISWVNFMYLKFGYLNIWPDREAIDKAMPQSFKDKYPKTRVIIDATEIKCQTPSSLVKHSETYSSYKSHTTFKGLIGISPSGHITFVSQLYVGSISDRELTVRSGFLKLPFAFGDIVMADKGFTISDLLEPMGIGLNIPSFVGSRSQQNPSEVIATQEIASERIHVERAINKVKNFQLFNQVVPLSLAGSLN